LVEVTVEVGERRPNNSSKIQECFFVDLISAKEFGVIAEISEEPGELPKRSFRAVESSGKGQCLMGGWFKDAEAKRQKGLLRMPAIRSPLDTNQKQPIEIAGYTVMSRLQTRNMSSHDLASTG
jgi:hypothetical protein